MRSARTERPFALMVIDIDRFKVINDSSGHVAGDAYLKLFAQLITAACACRPGRAAGRDEFCVLAAGDGVEDALIIAGRLTEACRRERLAHKGESDREHDPASAWRRGRRRPVGICSA